MNDCIAAYEILGNAVKRRSFDSVDPLFDDSIPSMTPESRQSFYEVFLSVFERNSRYQFVAFLL